MFSGIIEGTGRVLKIVPVAGGARLQIQSRVSLTTSKKGDSIAVNGCCLTITSKNGKSFWADLSRETLQVTHLKDLKKGELVNLERPIRLQDRLGGHLVMGHVDGVGTIRQIRPKGIAYEIEIEVPKKLRRYLIPKGSVAVDGISMTVNALTQNAFQLVVIPHTLKATNLKAKRAGDPVNLEVDMVSKYIENLLR